MKHIPRKALSALAVVALTSVALAKGWSGQISVTAPQKGYHGFRPYVAPARVQLGPRPYFLLEKMDDGALRDSLRACSERRSRVSDFSIAHRGAPLQFPEHTKESYEAAARMGAGLIECDVTFTADRELVCRHSQCDLHTTTNILSKPELAAKCSEPFTPADPGSGNSASARCCTSDITLDEFKSLCGKMDASDPSATTVEDYMNSTASFRTDLYASCGTLMTHAESIELIGSMGRKFTPELKEPSVQMPYQGEFTQQMYAQKLVDEYRAAGVSPRRVWPQSFNLDDVLYWIQHEPSFGERAVYLDARVDEPGGVEGAIANMNALAQMGVGVIAPPMWALVTLNDSQEIVASAYADAAREAGLDIITWTLERSGPLAAGGGYYYQSVAPVINNDGDAFKLLDVLAMEVGVLGVFSDWPATVTYYANCMGL